LVEFGHGDAEFGGLRGEAATFGYSSGAQFGELCVLDGEGGGLLFAAQLFGSGRGKLLVELLDALALAVVEACGLVEVGGGVATAFFEAGERGCSFGCGLLEILTTATKLV
jgi:hypothetical protein